MLFEVGKEVGVSCGRVRWGNHKLAHGYNDAQVIRWMAKQAGGGFRG